jgi:hypothetical protein
MKENKLNEKEIVEKIRNIGKYFQIFGYLKILLGIGIAFSIIGNAGLLNFYYSDTALTIVIGILYVIFGGRIAKNIDRNTKTYLRFFFWQLIIFAIIGFLVAAVNGEKSVAGVGISLVFAIYANSGLKKIKLINVEGETKHRLQGLKWIWFILGAIAFIGVGIFFDVYKYFIEYQEVTIDKNPQYSEISGNSYNNTKYNFTIEFPQGWDVQDATGEHIVKKATHEDSTIMVIVQQVDYESYKISSIKDVGTSKDFAQSMVDGMKENELYSNVYLTDYGSTTINGELAYWIKYSATYKTSNLKAETMSIGYYFTKSNTMYNIQGSTLAEDYSEVEPLFLQSIKTFKLK